MIQARMAASGTLSLLLNVSQNAADHDLQGGRKEVREIPACQKAQEGCSQDLVSL